MHKQYINVTNNGCDNYEYYYISSFDCNEIYKNSDAYNDNDNIYFYNGFLIYMWFNTRCFSLNLTF